MKKIVASIFLCVITVISAVSFSACGQKKLKIEKGEEVTEQEWLDAFSRAYELPNYTLNVTTNEYLRTKGVTYYRSPWSYSVSKQEEFNYKRKVSQTQTLLYDNGKNVFFDSTEKRNRHSKKIETSYYSNKEDEITKWNTKEREKRSSSSYNEFYETNEYDIDLFWRVNRRSYDSNLDVNEKYDINWEGRVSMFFADSELRQFNSNIKYHYMSEESYNSTTAMNISEMFDAFVYSDGVYKATLKGNPNLDEPYVTLILPCEITVSIKDGYLTGLAIKIDATGTRPDWKTELKSYTYKYERVYKITDIDNTDISVKLKDKELSAALNKLKAEN